MDAGSATEGISSSAIFNGLLGLIVALLAWYGRRFSRGTEKTDTETEDFVVAGGSLLDTRPTRRLIAEHNRHMEKISETLHRIQVMLEDEATHRREIEIRADERDKWLRGGPPKQG